MSVPSDRKPLLEGRGGVLIADFCLSTGLERNTVDELIKAGRLDGAWTEYPDPMRSGMIFDDALPTRDDLLAMGLVIYPD